MSLALPETPKERAALLEAVKYRWEINAREEQVPPYDEDWWDTWLYLGGRGTGKTRSGAEFVRHRVMNQGARRVHLVAPTAADTRDVMVEGDSGLLSVFPPADRPTYIASKRKIIFPTGAVALMFSADEPERLRGPQCDTLWIDEPASWRRPEAYDMACYGHRLGVSYGVKPLAAVTGTPKPVRLIKELISESQEGDGPNRTVYISRGSMLRNAANLAPSFLKKILDKYNGTRLGMQEIYAKVLDDNPNAMWTLSDIDRHRYRGPISALTFKKVIISLDPNIRNKDKDADIAGIIVLGMGSDGFVYVIADHSTEGGPVKWAKDAVKYLAYYKASYILYEENQGGDMIPETLKKHGEFIPMKSVFATDGKAVRAEPVALLYEQGLVRHVNVLPHLEEEQTQWDAYDPTQKSPNRVDALVHGVTDLTAKSKTIIIGGGNVRPVRY